ncbi:endonuclease/exonuclease/phosphatase family protein [Xylaria intraflava]|nr:endonuclease/exonuclease/phosphatase family protein [Xylaria intraflava]
MNDLVKKAIQDATILKKQPDSIPWNPDEPWVQCFYSWHAESEEWVPLGASAARGTGHEPHRGIGALALYSWNIDFMLPCPEARMQAALDHLENLLKESPSTATTAAVLVLQECTLADLRTIGQQQWIRDGFYITDTDTSDWSSGLYGTTTLVDRRLEVASCFRVHYSSTAMQRDALFVDVVIPTAAGSGKTIRVGNTHLESLVADPPLRPLQVQTAAKYMHESRLSGALLAGDFNAIQPFDRSLHTDNDLKDAYLELGGQEDADEGYTWGQQALAELRLTFGCSRMDKVYFRGDGLRLLTFERFGTDVEIHKGEKDKRDQVLSLGFEKPWITDHLGVKAVFSLTN